MLLGGEAGDALGDDLAAVTGVHQNLLRQQGFAPVGGAGDGECAGSVEAVALGERAGGQAVAVVGPLAQIEGDDHAAEQADDAA